MTPNAANGRNGLPQGDYSRHLLDEWIRVLRHLRNAWRQAKGLNTKLGKQHKPQLNLLDIMVTPKYHAPVMRSMRTACEESHRCPSLHPEPSLVLPAEFLTLIGDILGFLQPAFFVMSVGRPGPIHYALNHSKRELMKVRYGGARIEGTVVDSIPTQVGDTKSKFKPMGNYWQMQPVCGDERNGTKRGTSATIPTRKTMVLAECDSKDTEVLADSDVIGDNLPIPCAAVVDTGNRGNHRFFVVPTDEKEHLKAMLDGVWEMLGFDPTGWDNAKQARLPNTVRGKGRGGKPQMQTLLWFAPTPTRLNPTSRFQTWEQFLAAFGDAVIANAESITAEIKLMEASISKLEKIIADGNQLLGVNRRQKTGCATKASKGSAKVGIEELQARQDAGSAALTDCRRILGNHLKLAGDKLELSAEAKVAVIDDLSKRHAICDDPKANRMELERIVDKICATPNRPLGTGHFHGHRPAQNVSDEEFYKALNFHMRPPFGRQNGADLNCNALSNASLNLLLWPCFFIKHAA